MLHVRFSFRWGHSFPSFTVCVVTFRFLVSVPFPQVAEHSLHCVQTPTWQSTGEKLIFKLLTPLSMHDRYTSWFTPTKHVIQEKSLLPKAPQKIIQNPTFTWKTKARCLSNPFYQLLFAECSWVHLFASSILKNSTTFSADVCVLPRTKDERF